MAVPRFPTVFAHHYLAGSDPSPKTRRAVWHEWKARFQLVRGGGRQSRAVNVLGTSMGNKCILIELLCEV